MTKRTPFSLHNVEVYCGLNAHTTGTTLGAAAIAGALDSADGRAGKSDASLVAL